jgi:hypothetical protein
MISIGQKLTPFSHQSGISFLLPQTTLEAEIFPALVRIYQLKGSNRELILERKIPIHGPLKEFTVMQDLEKGCIAVWGTSLRYFILPNLEFVFAKNPHLPVQSRLPVLSLGSHKKMNVERMKRELDFTQIFPLWHRLGTTLPKLSDRKEKGGMFSLLEECHRASSSKPEEILESFKRLFLAGFRGLLVPRVNDDEHQGILEETKLEETPLHLLKEGAEIIQSLFIQSNEKGVEFLPALPPEFFAGRFMNVNLPSFGIFNFEWSKKMIRRVELKATSDGMISFGFHSSIRHFRLRTSLKEKGKVFSSSEPMEIKSGSLYLLDRFQK